MNAGTLTVLGRRVSVLPTCIEKNSKGVEVCAALTKHLCAVGIIAASKVAESPDTACTERPETCSKSL